MFDEKIPIFNVDWIHGIMPQLHDINKFLNTLQEIDSDVFKITHWIKLNKGLCSYKFRLGLDGQEAFNIAWNQDENKSNYYAADSGFIPGCFVSISGDAIRQLGSILISKVLKVLYDNGFRCGRIDVNCDIFDKTNDVIPMYLDASNNYLCQNYGSCNPVMLCRSVKNIHFVDTFDRKRSVPIRNLTMGTKTSERCIFKIYDKYYKVTNSRLDSNLRELLKKVPSDYWYKIEFEVRRSHAVDLFNDLAVGKCTVAQAFITCCRFYPILKGTANPNGEKFEAWENFLELCNDTK